MRSELSEIRSDISGLTSKVNDIEIKTATHSDTITKIQAELKDIRMKETHGLGPLTDKVLILESLEKKDKHYCLEFKGCFSAGGLDENGTLAGKFLTTKN